MKRSFRNLLIVGAAILGIAGASAADFTYPDFSSTTGIQRVGTASIAGTSLRLVQDGGGNQIGAAWRNDKQLIAGGFDTTFTFSIANQAGTTFGDGLAFVVQNSAAGASASGSDGGGIGYASNEDNTTSISNSLAVEIDLWDNGPSFPDPVFEVNPQPQPDLNTHISIQTRGTLPNSPNHLYSLGFFQDNAIKDGNVHSLRLLYQPGTLDVFVDNASFPAIVAAVDLSQLLTLDNGQAYVGFTSSNGGATSSQYLRSWSFQTTPEPATALLIALGALAACRRRR
jgi:hypothetical protein